ncbi:MAG: rod shape-determining protein MreD [Defluviimonas sp.]|uniref:rod shape-determining protein MreD n=1 Tax=Albidovulum sp. TaxID=1872424 RepID=UPI001D5A60F3|nr:rod shape-determining protein MreD [Paracoccaceae bacterium]MCC0064637.1 rod shape-determining protein MreD [Defluviimonas sp.]
MIDPVTTQRIGFRAAYLGIAVFLLFVQILPLDLEPVRLPWPDFILLITFVWVLRRPDFVTGLMIAAVFFAEDLVTMRPPGLWTALVLLATEFLRSREAILRDMPFALEWAVAAGLVLVVSVIDWLVLALFMVPQAEFALVLTQTLTTVLAYPLVAGLSRAAFRARRSTRAEPGGFGQRP